MVERYTPPNTSFIVGNVEIAIGGSIPSAGAKILRYD